MANGAVCGCVDTVCVVILASSNAYFPLIYDTNFVLMNCFLYPQFSFWFPYCFLRNILICTIFFPRNLLDTIMYVTTYIKLFSFILWKQIFCLFTRFDSFLFEIFKIWVLIVDNRFPFDYNNICICQQALDVSISKYRCTTVWFAGTDGSRCFENCYPREFSSCILGLIRYICIMIVFLILFVTSLSSVCYFIGLIVGKKCICFHLQCVTFSYQN